ncbi:MAG: DUF418 domain-containing protein, partial [Bdellovibrionales bacterium]|nr:DUF418 domain-containing protein [Bdellovibrionales bacterium]
VRRLPSSVILLLMLVIVVLAPFLRSHLDYFSFWRNANFEYAARWDGVHDLIGFFVTGYFPIFPWLFFPLSGFLVARCLFTDEARGRVWATRLFALGVLSLVVGPVLQAFGNPWGWNLRGSFYPLSSFRLLASIGLCLVVYLCFYRVFDVRQSVLPQYFDSMSRSSLTLYLVHHFVILWPLWIAGALEEDVAKYFQKSMEPYQALLLGFVFLLAWIPISKAWRSRGYKYGAEWLLKKLT